MTLPKVYTTGTISVANGSTAVTGVGTGWLNVVGQYDVLRKNGLSVSIESVEANGALTLSEPWPGTSLVDATYQLAVTYDGPDFQLRVRQLLENLPTGYTGIGIDAVGLLADRATYDAKAEGFVFLSLDGDGISITTPVVYVKQSDTSADWSSAIDYRGPIGATGGSRYDLAFWDPARATNGETVGEHVFTTAVNFSLNLAGSQGKAAVAATASAVWSIRKNGVEFATATFAISGTTATFTGAATSFAAGDMLELIAPNPRDATLSNVKFTFTGLRP